MGVKQFIKTNKNKLIVGSAAIGVCVFIFGGATMYRYSVYNDLMIQASEYPQMEGKYDDVGILIKKDTLVDIENDITKYADETAIKLADLEAEATALGLDVEALTIDCQTDTDKVMALEAAIENEELRLAQIDAEKAGVDVSSIDTEGMTAEEQALALEEATKEAEAQKAAEAEQLPVEDTSNDSSNSGSSGGGSNNSGSNGGSNSGSSGGDSNGDNSGNSGGGATPEPEPIACDNSKYEYETQEEAYNAAEKFVVENGYGGFSTMASKTNHNCYSYNYSYGGSTYYADGTFMFDNEDQGSDSGDICFDDGTGIDGNGDGVISCLNTESETPEDEVVEETPVDDIIIE